jgi:hypothetical protein
MPARLHEELAQAADREGASLNQFITSVLAGAVGWRREDSIGTGRPESAKRRPRFLTILLAANLLLVAAAAASAIAFLVLAWLSD